MRSFLLALLLLTTATSASACPFCPAPQVTLSERVSRADVVVLGQWLSAARKSETTAAATRFKLIHLAVNPDNRLHVGDKIVLSRFHAGQPGDLFLLLGQWRTVIEWNDPLPVTETGYQYVLKAPPPESRQSERIAYFLKFLEYPDETIAADAFSELGSAAYDDLVPLADQFPRDRLRQWLKQPDFTNPRLGLFGLMLGLCGTPADVELLAGHIAAPMRGSKEFRMGIDGMIGGYLLLTGEQGLNFIDKEKLRNDQAPATEIYSTMQALRFLWTYAEGTISKDRLKQSMRILLDRPDLADIAITDLARWKDWSIQDRLMKLYEKKEYQAAHVKQAIVNYTLVASRDVSPDTESVPEHVTCARQCLKVLRKKDPALVRRAERLLLP